MKTMEMLFNRQYPKAFICFGMIFLCFGVVTAKRTTALSIDDPNNFNYNVEDYNRHHQQQYSKSSVHNQRKYYGRRMERRNEQQNVAVTNEKHYASPRIVVLGATGNHVLKKQL